MLIFSSAWCISWAGYDEADMIPIESVSQILKRLVNLWLNIGDSYCALKRTISWGIYSTCMPGLQIQVTDKLKEAIDNHFYFPKNDFDRRAAIHLAVLTSYWTKEKTKQMLNQEQYPSKMPKNYSRFLQNSGFKRVSKQTSPVQSMVEMELIN